METIFDASCWEIIWKYRGTFINGFLNTLMTAAAGLVLAIIIGIIVGLLSTGESKFLRALARIYVEFFQNTPVILQVCFLYYALTFAGAKVSVVVVGIISLGIYTGAYMAEVIRAGITSIPIGQFDAAWSQGFDRISTMWFIILPQTIKIILPPMVNQMANLIKNTSCLFIVGGADLIATTYNFVTGETTGGAYGPAYLIGGLLFFCMCYPLSMVAGKWEQHLKKQETITSTDVGEEAA